MVANAPEPIATSDAPAPVGPYSQAVAAGDYVFLAGQVALDPATGRLVDGGVEAQTERVMDNLAAVLQAAGLSFAQVVKTTIYLASLEDFGRVNGVYARRFGGCPPARSTVQVSRLPRDAAVEIDMVAYRPRPRRARRSAIRDGRTRRPARRMP